MRARPTRRVRLLILLAAAVALSGCGLSAGPASNPVRTLNIVVHEPPRVGLAVQLPGARPTAASAFRYSTSRRAPVIRGSVHPAGATLYVRSPSGALTTVQPHRNGSFEVRTALAPGRNAFQFIGYQLGSISATARVAITCRCAAAAPAVSDPSTATPAGQATAAGPVTVSATAGEVVIDPIRAPAPPSSGGDGRWMNGFELTEYYPALEAWSVGADVPAPGLTGEYPIDWLYGAHGLSMEGEGIATDGSWFHIAGLGAGGWLTAGGTPASFGTLADAPFWRTGGYWRTAGGGLTYPLAGGGWSNGPGVKYIDPPAGISFAPGPAKPLGYLRSIAVDPRVIPLGSYVYIPAYAAVNGGWFVAQDTGGAITGRHIDVFVPPPSSPDDSGGLATGQQVYVVRPGQAVP